MYPTTYKQTNASPKILTINEIDDIWKKVSPSNSSNATRRGDIPLIKVPIDANLLNKHGFDITKCYTLCLSRLKNHKEKPHLDTIAKVRNLIYDIENFFYFPECYDHWGMGFSDYCFSNSKNTQPSIKEHYILNTLNDRLSKLMKEERWDICVNQIIITLDAFKAEKTNSFHILRKFAILIAPFLPYTAERVWYTLATKDKKSIFCENYPVADKWFSRKGYTSYQVFINDDTRFIYESYDLMPEDMMLETFKSSVSLAKHLDGRIATKIKIIKDRYIIVNAE